MAKPITDYKALTFDCYGTLIDWEGGVWDALQPLLVQAAESRAAELPGRSAALAAFGEEESRLQAEQPSLLYPDLLAEVHHRMAQRWGMETSSALDAAFGQSIAAWPAFPDTAEALRALKRHYKLIILSNVNRAGFAASNRKLGVTFDAIYTAEDVGSYKPNRGNFTYMLDHLKRDHGLESGDILHTAQSLFHDHVPASDFGLAKAWIDRQLLAKSGEWGATAVVAERPEVDFYFTTMGEMAAAVEAA